MKTKRKYYWFISVSALTLDGNSGDGNMWVISKGKYLHIKSAEARICTEANLTSCRILNYKQVTKEEYLFQQEVVTSGGIK